MAKKNRSFLKETNKDFNNVLDSSVTIIDSFTDLYPNGASAKTAGFTAEAGYIYLITDLDGCAVVLPVPVTIRNPRGAYPLSTLALIPSINASCSVLIAIILLFFQYY